MTEMEPNNSPPDGHPQPAVIGIDFGSSKCCVAAVRDGRVLVLENEFGQRTTPSCVAFNSQQRLVGGAALDQAVLNCTNTVHAVKRTLGRTYEQVKGLLSECEIRKNYSYPYNIRYRVNYRKKQLQLSPEQITAMLLTKMKGIAESSLGCPVDRAVISVPASYGNAQRVALKTAAKVAGLQVLQLINETTAAGIAFGDNRTVKTPVRIAVVDFGAAKLDISIMEVEGNCVRVIAAAGSPYLGGCSVDEALVNHCVGVINQKYERKVFISQKGYVKLRLACEKVKKTLSLLPEAPLCIESLFEDQDVKISVSRKDLNMLIEEEIRKEILEIFESILQEKKIPKEAIDRVVLVGGSTRIPVVKSILEEYFGAHKLDQTVNQDEAVAQGAALRAAALSGPGKGIEVLDVSSFHVCYREGFKGEDNVFFSKFSLLPCVDFQTLTRTRKTEMFFFERMRSVSGRSLDIILGSLILEWSTYLRFSNLSTAVKLQLDEDGIFSFSAVPQNSTTQVKIEPSEFHPTSDHIIDWVKQEKNFRSDTAAELKRVDVEVELESLCFELESVLSYKDLVEHSSPLELEPYEKAISKIKDWISKNIESAPLEEISQKMEKLKNVQKDVKRIADTAQKKALEKEEADLKRAEMMESFEFHLSAVICALDDVNLERYSHSQQLVSLKGYHSRLKRWKEANESSSLTVISPKFKELMQLKIEVAELKAESHKKALEEEEAVRKRAKMEFFESHLSAVTCALDDVDLERYSNSQQLVSLKSTHSRLQGWKKNEARQLSSLAEVSHKLEELMQLKNEVVELKAKAHQRALEEEEVARKRSEMMGSFESHFSEVIHKMDDVNLERESYYQQLQSYKTRLSYLEAWKETNELSSLTEVSQKLEELIQLKKEVTELKAKAYQRALEEEEAAKTALVHSPEAPIYSDHNSYSNFTKSNRTRNVALNSINEKNKQTEKVNDFSATYNSDAGLVASSNAVRIPNNGPADRCNSSSVSRAAAEEKEHLSCFRSCQGSQNVVKECRSSSLSSNASEEISSQHQIASECRQPSEVTSRERLSTSRSRQNSGDSVMRHRSSSRPRMEAKDQRDRHRSSSRPRMEAKDQRVEHRSSSRSRMEAKDQRVEHRSSFRSSQSFENEIMKDRSRSPLVNEKRKDDQRVSNRERSSSRTRHGSVHSKKSSQPCSSVNDEQYGRQNDHSIGGQVAEEIHHHQPRQTNRNVSDQNYHGHTSGATLENIKKSAIKNNATLPNKMSDGKKFSKEMQTCPTATASTQTDFTSLESSRWEDEATSSEKVSNQSGEDELLIKKFKDLGILLPLLEIIDKSSSNLVDCELCAKLRIVCFKHYNEAVGKFYNVLKSLPKISLSSSHTASMKTDTKRQSSLTPGQKDVGATERASTSSFNLHTDHTASTGAVGSVHESTTTASGSRHSLLSSQDLVDRSSVCAKSEGLTGTSHMYNPVYRSTANLSATDHRTGSYSTLSGGTSVRDKTLKYEKLSSS
ncbi:Heat shock protein 70 family [Trinorchestia longiramus]|nr:Heat shock protein 70 family [Trinorchestia longiramus]